MTELQLDDDLILAELPPPRIPRDFPELEGLPKTSEGSFMTRDKTSQFLGVSRKRHQWAVEIWAHGVRHYIGLFRSQKEAARAYDEQARKLHGPAAKLNFPRPGEAWCGLATRYRGIERPSRFDPEALPYRKRYRSRGHGPDQF